MPTIYQASLEVGLVGAEMSWEGCEARDLFYPLLLTLSRSISLGGKIQRRTGLTVTLQSVCVIIHLSYVVFYGKRCARAVQKRLNRSFFGFSGHATNEK